MVVRHKPQSLAAQPGNILDVDGFLVFITQRMFEQQHDRVNNIFFVDLHNLHFFEQHLCQGNAWMIDFQSIVPIDHMAEGKLFIEYIDVNADFRPVRRWRARLRKR